jgi:hypothetical protein
MKITEHLEELTIFEKKADSFKLEHPNIQIVFGEAESVDSTNRLLILKGTFIPVLGLESSSAIDIVHLAPTDSQTLVFGRRTENSLRKAVHFHGCSAQVGGATS